MNFVLWFLDCDNSTYSAGEARCAAITSEIDCSLEYNCHPCYMLDSIGLDLERRCVYSPPSICRRKVGQQSDLITGASQCPVQVENDAPTPTDRTGYGNEPCQMCLDESDADFADIMRVSNEGIPRSLLASLSLANITDSVQQSQCSPSSLAACSGVATAELCSSTPNCRWCSSSAASKSVQGYPRGQCIFGPTTPCQLNGRRYTSTCQIECGLAQVACTSLKTKQACEAGTGSTGDDSSTSCAWCPDTQVSRR